MFFNTEDTEDTEMICNSIRNSVTSVSSVLKRKLRT